MTTNKELRELAEKAASGVWYEPGDLLCHDNRSGETHGLHHDDDRYLAAASPVTVLALLDEIEALQVECEELKRALSESQANDRQAMAYACHRVLTGGDQ